MKILTFDTNKSTETIDFEVIANLDNKFFPQPWTRSQWEQQLRSGDQFLAELIIEDRPVGFCLFSISKLERMGHLLKILVSPEARGQGFGEKLHDSILNDAVSEGLNSLYLEVSTQNASAIKLYENLGYKVLVTKKKFYSNGDDAYAMQRTLN